MCVCTCMRICKFTIMHAHAHANTRVLVHACWCPLYMCVCVCVCVYFLVRQRQHPIRYTHASANEAALLFRQHSALIAKTEAKKADLESPCGA